MNFKHGVLSPGHFALHVQLPECVPGRATAVREFVEYVHHVHKGAWVLRWGDAAVLPTSPCWQQDMNSSSTHGAVGATENRRQPDKGYIQQQGTDLGE